MSTFAVKQRQPPGAVRECKRATLGSLVTSKMDEFDKQRRSLPHLKAQLEAAELDLRKNPTFVKEREIRDLRDLVREIESGESEMDYLLTIAPIIRAYGDEGVAGADALAHETGEDSEDSESPAPDPGPDPDPHVRTKGSLNRQYVELLKTGNETDTFISDAGMCPACNQSMVVTPDCMSCPDCGLSVDVIESSFRTCTYREHRPVPFFTYKRINHFNEWLQRFQGKDRATIPDSVFERVRDEMKRMRVPEKHMTQVRLRAMLKKLGLNKYYEHVPRIFHAITGEPLPQLSLGEEEKLRNMFMKMQEPFARACPSDRKNFLSYSFVLLKLAQLLQLDDILDAFSLLKSKEKLYVQEKVWKSICEQLGWKYIRTI